jgi:hypothetical protein
MPCSIRRRVAHFPSIQRTTTSVAVTWSLQRCGRVHDGAPSHYPCSGGGGAGRRRDTPSPPVPLLRRGNGVWMKGRRAVGLRVHEAPAVAAMCSWICFPTAAARTRSRHCSSSLPSGSRRGRTVGVWPAALEDLRFPHIVPCISAPSPASPPTAAHPHLGRGEDWGGAARIGGRAPPWQLFHQLPATATSTVQPSIFSPLPADGAVTVGVWAPLDPVSPPFLRI